MSSPTRPFSGSPTRRIMQEQHHNDAVMRRVDSVLEAKNPFSIGLPPAKAVSQTSAHLYKKADAVEHVRPNTSRKQWGAQIDFDKFFELDPKEPVFSKTDVRLLKRAQGLQEILKQHSKVYGDSSYGVVAQSPSRVAQNHGEYEVDRGTFLTAIQAETNQDFQDQLLEMKGQRFEKRKEALRGQSEQLFDLKRKFTELDREYNTQQELRAKNEEGLQQLQTQQRQLLELVGKRDTQIEELQETLQCYNAIKPLLSALETQFPRRKPLDSLKTLDDLSIQLQQLQGVQGELQQQQKELQHDILGSITDQTYVRDEKISQVSNGDGPVLAEIQRLEEENQHLQMTFLQSATTQEKYLQACQDVTTFWAKVTQLYGTQLQQQLNPSVNKPIEVLRALDTVLTVAFPESQKALDNHKRISAQAVAVWQKLLSKTPEANALRTDTYGCLCKAMDIFKANHVELAQLKQTSEYFRKKYWKAREEIDAMLDQVDSVVQEMRARGLNVPKLQSIQGWQRGVKKTAQIEEEQRSRDSLKIQQHFAKRAEADFYFEPGVDGFSQ